MAKEHSAKVAQCTRMACEKHLAICGRYWMHAKSASAIASAAPAQKRALHEALSVESAMAPAQQLVEFRPASHRI